MVRLNPLSPKKYTVTNNVFIRCTVLLEHFVGEKPLRMSQIRRKFDPLQPIAFWQSPLQPIAFWQRLCVFTMQIDQPSQSSRMFDARKTF